MFKEMKKRCLVAVIGLGGASCGADSASSELEGLYEINDWVLDESCTSVGETKPVVQPTVMLKLQLNDGGIDASLCRSTSECAPAWRASSGSDERGWQGELISFEPMIGDVCRASMETVVVTRQGDGRVRLEVRQHGEATFRKSTCSTDESASKVPVLSMAGGREEAADDGCVPGVCLMERAAAACGSNACVFCEVIKATRTAR